MKRGAARENSRAGVQAPTRASGEVTQSMSTNVRTPNQCTDTDTDCPGDWERVDGDLAHGDVERFVHAVTGQVVRVRRQRRPTQMHDPMSASDDTGYRTLVEDEYAAPISPDLSDESIAREAAREFMAAYPDGDFEIPHPREQPYGGSPVEW